MTEQRNAMAKLFAACWKDDALKARFMSDPKAVLAERGIDVPDGMNVNVLENSNNTVHITMPKVPSGVGNLSEEDLVGTSGGLDCCGGSNQHGATGPQLNVAIAAVMQTHVD